MKAIQLRRLREFVWRWKPDEKLMKGITNRRGEKNGNLILLYLLLCERWDAHEMIVNSGTFDNVWVSVSMKNKYTSVKQVAPFNIPTLHYELGLEYVDSWLTSRLTITPVAMKLVLQFKETTSSWVMLSDGKIVVL